jgi:hypothetical protein
MITSYSNGNKIKYINNQWIYEDDVSIEEIRICPKCKKYPTLEGYDGCLGHILGAKAACCGHGVEEGFILY